MENHRRKWLVCAGCAIVLFCTSGLAVNAFTVYQPYILRCNGFTNTQSSTMILLRSLFSFLSMFLTKKYYELFSYRIGLILAGFMAAVSLGCFSMAESFAAYCISAAIMGLAFGLGTMIPITILLSGWFDTNRTVALGICSSATGLSTLGIPSVLTKIIENRGLAFTFRCEAAAVAGMMVIALLLLKNPKTEETKGLQPAVSNVTTSTEIGALPKRVWWLLVPMLLLSGAVTSVGYSHLSVVMMASGFSAKVIAAGITASGLALTVGKLLYGVFSEKTSVYLGNWVFGLLATVGLGLICVNGGNDSIIFMGLVLYGGGLAFTTVGMSAWCGELCSGPQYASTVRRFQIGYAAGTMLFSSFPGILADYCEGSYIPAFAFFAGSCAAVLFSIQWVIRRHRKGTQSSQKLCK